MNFDLHRPCDQCPFLRVGGVKHLGRRRALEIGTMLADRQGGTFPCHKTTLFDEDTGEHVSGKREQHCAGALILAERVNPAGTQYMRIAERLGFYDRNAYTGGELVFETVEDFVEAQA